MKGKLLDTTDEQHGPAYHLEVPAENFTLDFATKLEAMAWIIDYMRPVFDPHTDQLIWKNGKGYTSCTLRDVNGIDTLYKCTIEAATS